jgi:hypothetical protein
MRRLAALLGVAWLNVCGLVRAIGRVKFRRPNTAVGCAVRFRDMTGAPELP